MPKLGQDLSRKHTLEPNLIKDELLKIDGWDSNTIDGNGIFYFPEHKNIILKQNVTLIRAENKNNFEVQIIYHSLDLNIKANAHYYLGMIYENSNSELDWFIAIREYINALEIDKNFNFSYGYDNP
ncbi:MAG: hypothetical protein O7C59_11445, partial [Rickettsia endosymbiont of Ixodes persulcatus]|nr:hypothetical protein [Rickettsia endosymbiont of Ixodes persulcatus]